MHYSDKPIFIVNGHPRAGKDTFTDILGEQVPIVKYSIIDKVKTVAKSMLGWKGYKREVDRKFLCDLKNLTTEYNDMSFMDVYDKVQEFYEDDTKSVMFIDMREPEDIERAKRVFGARTIFIKNDRVKPITTNPADAGVENYEYDFVIENNGTLAEFEDNIRKFYYDEFLVNDYKNDVDGL